MKFDGWPWKAIGHLFYTMSIFVHHFKSIDEFKLEWQSANSRVKIVIFLSRVTLKFDEWPWKTIGHLFCTTLSFVHHFTAISEFKDRDKDKIKEDLRSIGLGWPLVTPSHMYVKRYKKKKLCCGRGTSILPSDSCSFYSGGFINNRQ